MLVGREDIQTDQLTEPRFRTCIRSFGGEKRQQDRRNTGQGVSRAPGRQSREAEQLYRRVLRSRSNHTDALHLLGVLSYQAGNNGQALEFYRKVVAFAPRAGETHHNMGIVLQAEGRDDEAVEAYLKALELRPNHAETIGHLARLCEERNRLDDAADWVAKGLAATPDDPLINLIAARLERRDGKTD